MAKVAKVAIAAAAIYYGGGALMGSFGATGAAWGTAGGLGSIGTAGVVGGGLSMSTALSIGGLGMQAMGKVQQRKYMKQQSSAQQSQVDASNKADAARNRYNNLLAKRSRLNTIRSARVQQGRVEAATGGAGLGAGGTSGFSGAVGGIGTQASANLGNQNVATDVGNQISGLNTQAANYGSEANTAKSNAGMWTATDTLGGELFKGGGEIATLFGQK